MSKKDPSSARPEEGEAVWYKAADGNATQHLTIILFLILAHVPKLQLFYMQGPTPK